ncbi:two-component system response regulator RssB [Martelella alba]|uniref:Two-component system response regulator RssB n=1 Tax=Martelella alba TaxID=2590451 RepID=A0ABY2SPY5_9HYPH|nr:two-component system response regulator RssB [Martelella alba]TKI08159.1 two-component system response regulator RssB [Martelella alba]
MAKPLLKKQILVIEDEAVFRSVLSQFLQSLGAEVREASHGGEALHMLTACRPDLIICDLEMPEMNGLAFVERFRQFDTATPILIVSGTDQMTDIARVLRLGVQDVLLKPLDDFARLRETVLGCLYPDMFTSQVDEEEQLFQDWDALSQHPGAAAKLLKQLQPPVQQTIARCKVNYRQLTMAEQPGLVLDIAALSEHDLAFYCLDVTRAEEKGVLAALLLRALFNGLLQAHIANRSHRLPELSTLLKQVNQLLRKANLDGQFPLLVGYYHRGLNNLILVSAGLNATLTANSQQVRLNSGVPLGTMNSAYLNQISQHCASWQCQVWGNGGRLRLMLSTE